MRKTYTMANIIPQSPLVNRKTWIKAEKYERLIALKLGEVSVLNGVIYGDNPKRIGKSNLSIPLGFWKMIFNDKKNFKKCFYYKNDLNIETKNDKLRSHLIDCEEIK